MYRVTHSYVEKYLETCPDAHQFFKLAIAQGERVNGEALVNAYLNPMIACIYADITRDVSASTLTIDAARFYIKELSVFARYNSQFLKRAAESVSGFCPELAHELLRNHLEEGGARGKLPPHFLVYSAALIRDLDLMVNGYVPQASSTRTLVLMHDVIVNSHSASTILGMYYATEAVAIAETEELQRITNRLGELMKRGRGASLANLHYYYEMHLSDVHEAAQFDQAVEAGHQEGLAHFVRSYALYNFNPAQMIDGFLQILGPLVDQWSELNQLTRSSDGWRLSNVS